MSNIFKRLRLMGRSKEKEEVNGNHGAEPQQNNRVKIDTERHHEENLHLARGDFHHQRPRYRKGARKRLCFPSRHDSEPPVNCSKSCQERNPPADHKGTKHIESEDAGLLKDSITGNEISREMSDHAVAGRALNLSTEGADDLNESFEVLMPDLSFGNGSDQSAKKMAQRSNEATPEPPILHRMDTGPRPHWSSKVDVNLSVKSPVTRSQSRKEDLQLLKLLCSDDDTTSEKPLPLFSLSKDKRRPGFPFHVAPLKVSEPRQKSLKKSTSQIEKNDLNTPLAESSIMSASIMTRSSRKRKQMACGEKNNCIDLNAIAPESLNLLDREAEDLNGNIVRNSTDKQGIKLERENDKENRETVGKSELRESIISENPLKSVDKNQENSKELTCKYQRLMFSASPENLTMSNDIKTNCLQDDPVEDKDEMQLKERNASQESDKRESMESTILGKGLHGTEESSEPTAFPEVCHDKICEEPQSETTSLQRAGNHHPKTKLLVEGDDHQEEREVLQGVDKINGIESKNGSLSRECSGYQSSQVIADLAEVHTVDNSSEENNEISDETTVVREIDVDPVECDVKDTSLGDIKDPIKQDSPRPPQVIEADNENNTSNSQKCPELNQETVTDGRLDDMNTVRSNITEPYSQKRLRLPQVINSDNDTKELTGKNGPTSSQVIEADDCLEALSTVDYDTKKQSSQKTQVPPKVTNGDTMLHEVSTARSDTMVVNSQKSPEAPQLIKTEDRLDEMSTAINSIKESNSQNSLEPPQETEADTTLDELKKSLGLRREVFEKMEFDEDSSRGELFQPVSHRKSKATVSPKGMDRSEGVYIEAQQTMVNVPQEARCHGLFSKGGIKGGETSISRMTEASKSTKFETHVIGGVGFDYRTACLPCVPHNNPVRCDLSPTITPRDTYEMFAAPNSYGDFNGRWPITEGNRSCTSTRGRRGRKRKTELWQRARSYPDGNLNAYNLPGNDFDLNIAAPGSYCLQRDGTFTVIGPMFHSQSQGLSNAGSYCEDMASVKLLRRRNDLDLARAALSDSGMGLQGASRKVEFDPSRIDPKDYEDHRNSANILSQKHRGYNDPFIQGQFDGLCMIDSRGCYVPVNSYGPLIPPSGFQDRFIGPLGQQYSPDPNQYRESQRNIKTENSFMCDEKQRNGNYQFMVENSRPTLKASADGDRRSIDSNQQTTIEETEDILDALKILLRDAFDPSVADPGDLLATYGAELLKDDELRMDFIHFCEELLSYEIMKNQSEGYFPGAYGDYPYPNQAPLWPPPNQYPPGCYPSDIAYFYDGESYLPMRVQPDQQGNMCMMLPDGHPNQYGPKDFIPIYAGPEGLCVNIDSFTNPGAEKDPEQLSGNLILASGSTLINKATCA